MGVSTLGAAGVPRISSRRSATLRVSGRVNNRPHAEITIRQTRTMIAAAQRPILRGLRIDLPGDAYSLARSHFSRLHAVALFHRPGSWPDPMVVRSRGLSALHRRCVPPNACGGKLALGFTQTALLAGADSTTIEKKRRPRCPCLSHWLSPLG